MTKHDNHNECPPQILADGTDGLPIRKAMLDVLGDWVLESDQALDELVIMTYPGRVLDVCQLCRNDPRLSMEYLRCLSVVDYGDYLQVVYHLYSLSHQHKAVIKANVPYENLVIPSIISVYSGATWYEREGHDLFGLTFEGHPDLRPLLLYDGFEGYPGRRSYPFFDYQEW